MNDGQSVDVHLVAVQFQRYLFGAHIQTRANFIRVLQLDEIDRLQAFVVPAVAFLVRRIVANVSSDVRREVQTFGCAIQIFFFFFIAFKSLKLLSCKDVFYFA